MFAIRPGRALLFALPCGLLAAAITLSAAPPDGAKAEPILRERLEVMKQIAGIQLETYQRGEANFDSVLLAQQDLLNAELELTDEPLKRIEIYERVVKTRENLEAFTNQLYDSGEATTIDVLKSKAARLKAQADLIRESAEPKSHNE